MDDDNDYDDDLDLESMPSIMEICSSLEQIIQNTRNPNSKEERNETHENSNDTTAIMNEKPKNGGNIGVSYREAKYVAKSEVHEVKSGTLFKYPIGVQDTSDKRLENVSKEDCNLSSRNCPDWSAGTQCKGTAGSPDMLQEEKLNDCKNSISFRKEKQENHTIYKGNLEVRRQYAPKRKKLQLLNEYYYSHNPAPFPLACKICHKTILTEKDINLHYIAHSKERYLNLLSHGKNKEAQPMEYTPLFICQICNKSFLVKSNLDSHYQSHSLPRTLQCSSCNELFCSTTNVNIPVLKEVQLFQCSMCKQRENYLASEKETFENGNEGFHPVHYKVKVFQCSFCNQVFNQKSLLNAHQKALGHRETYPCVICGKVFLGKQTLHNHYSRHKWQKCTLCKRMCITKHALDIHYKYSHGDIQKP